MPGYSAIRLSLLGLTTKTMLGLTTKTYSPEPGKRSHRKMNNRHIKPVCTLDSHTHDSRSGNIQLGVWRSV